MYHQKKFFWSCVFLIRGLVNELIDVSHALHACTVGLIPLGTIFLFIFYFFSRLRWVGESYGGVCFGQLGPFSAVSGMVAMDHHEMTYGNLKN